MHSTKIENEKGGAPLSGAPPSKFAQNPDEGNLMQCPTPRPDPANMDVFALQRNIVDSLRARTDQPPSACEKQPRHVASEGDAGGMLCTILAWVAAQTDLSLNLQGFLLRLANLIGPDGTIALTQTQIAARVGLKERQTRALLSKIGRAHV